VTDSTEVTDATTVVEPVEEVVDPRVIEDMPPVDEIDAALPPPTHEEIVAQLLTEAESLTEPAFKDGFLSLPEVEISIFGITISYAVVLEEITLEDGTTSLVVAAVKEVEPREGVVIATYSLENGQAMIPEVAVTVAAAPAVATEAPVESTEAAVETTEASTEVTVETTEASVEATDAIVEATVAEVPAEEVATPVDEDVATDTAVTESPAEEVVATEEVAEPAPTIVTYYNVVLAVTSIDPLEFAIESYSETPPVADETATEEPVADEAATEEVVADETATEEEVVVDETATEEVVVDEEEVVVITDEVIPDEV
jgi:hypothetical protein